MKRFRLFFVLGIVLLMCTSCGVTLRGQYADARIITDPYYWEGYYNYYPYSTSGYYWDGVYWRPSVNVYISRDRHHRHHPTPPPPKPKPRHREPAMTPHQPKPIPHHNQPNNGAVQPKPHGTTAQPAPHRGTTAQPTPRSNNSSPAHTPQGRTNTNGGRRH